MRLSTFAIALSVSLFVASTACSGGDGGSSSGSACTSSGEAPPALSAYCTVQTLVELKPLRWRSSQAWGGASTGETLAAGSTMFLETGFGDRVEGYAFLCDGVPAKVVPVEGISEDLVEGTHYSGTCERPAAVARAGVLLRDANLFASEDLSGEPCKLTVGTELASYGYVATGDGAGSLSSPTIETTCGFSPGFSKDIALASLVKKN